MSTNGRSYRMKGIFAALVVQSVLSCVCGILSEKYIQTFKEVCPYNNLCNENASKVNTNPDRTPCCEECFCEADCYAFQNCCPDMVTFEATDKSLVIPCLPWYNIYGINLTLYDPSFPYGYRVISSCSPGNVFNKSTVLCQNASRSLDNVVSDSKGRVYRNEECALCHGVTAFTRWEIRVYKCDGLFFQTFETLEDRDEYVLNQCLALAIPPEEQINRCVLSPTRTCAKTIESDSAQIGACHDTTNNIIIYRQSYRSLIAYANADCFLCNNPLYGNGIVDKLCKKNELKNIGLLNNFVSYTLIDYQKSVNTHVKMGGMMCNVTDVYDSITKKCRTLICPRGSMAIDGQCVNSVRMTGMAIVFTFPQEFTYVELGMLQLSDLIKCALILEEYVQTTYGISCEICRETRNDLRSLPMLLAVSSTCPMETLKHIAREMSTMLTYLNVTISGRLITLPVFANVAMYEPQGKPIVKGCDKVYFVAGLAIPIHECPSVQLSFTDMKNAGISNAKMNQLTFSGCIGLKSNDPNMLNISHLRNIHDNCPPSDLQSNASRVYTVCIDSYFRLRNSSSSSKWVDLICFSIIVFEVMLYICICV